MRQIAKEAGTSTSRLYVAFDSKPALYAAVASRGNRRLVADYVVPAMSGDGPPWERIMAVADAYLRFYIDERALVTLMISTKVDPSDPHPAMRELVATQESQVGALFALARELTEDSEIDGAYAVRWVWAAFYGIASLNDRLPHLAVSDDEFDAIASLGLRFVRAGLREAGLLERPSQA